VSAFRLDAQPREVLDRTRGLSFSWDGRPYEGLAGDTIASALAANGVRVLSRSFKYHRPRGLLTASYHDPGAIVQVGAEPNVRAAHRRLVDGMVVTPQNAWPSLRFDVKAVKGIIGRFLPPGMN
jgi:sarcosine oxidase, subunit alpha